jgi:hypothetical protein
MKTKVRVKKLRSQEVESRIREQIRAAAGDAFVNSSTAQLLDFSTLRATKMTKQTGNVHEKKGPSQELEIRQPRTSTSCQGRSLTARLLDFLTSALRKLKEQTENLYPVGRGLYFQLGQPGSVPKKDTKSRERTQ